MIIGAIAMPNLQLGQAEPWTRNTFRQWLARWDVDLAYTNLEGEFGLLFAQTLHAARIPYRVLLPAQIARTFNDEATRLAVMKAAALQRVNSSADDVWEGSRSELVQLCDLVFVAFSPKFESNASIENSQFQACLSKRTVIALYPAQQASKVICRHHSID